MIEIPFQISLEKFWKFRIS